MSILDTPRAKTLVDEATISADDVAGCEGRLAKFLERYLPLFYRKEQGENAGVVIRGLLSDLERKTCEPVAHREGRARKPIQFFVGRGLWDDEKVMGELRRHVTEDLADPDGWGGTSPAVTVQQVRQVFSKLLRDPPPTASEIAKAVTQILRRNAESRIYHWCSATGRYPPSHFP